MTQETAPRRPNPGYDSRPKCAAIKQDGTRCRSFSVDDAGYCYMHSSKESIVQHRKTAWRLGGYSSAKERRGRRLMPPHLAMLYDDLGTAWVQVADGTMPPSRGQALASIANAMRGVFNDSVMEQRLRDLESVAPDEGADAVVEDD